MKHYAYNRIKRLAEQLETAGINPGIANRILEGGEDVLRKTSPAKKADWFRAAMTRMDDLLDCDIRNTVREGCACCLGGRRQKISKGIAAGYETLEERIQAANEAKYVFGHSVQMMPDGNILVRFFPEGLDHYRCVCLPQAKEPLSITYCYCCGGHVKHHLQTALGRELDCTVLSSALSSGGTESCVFSFRVVEEEAK